ICRVVSGGLLFFQQPVVKLAQNVRQIARTIPCMVTIRQIVKDAAKRRPVEADANTEVVRAAVEVVTKFLVAAGSIIPAVIVTVNEKGHMALFFILAMRQCRELVRSPRQ